MRERSPPRWAWPAAAVAAALAATAVLVLSDLRTRRDAFETDARIAHRLLSQRAVQHDAILATLTLLQPAEARAGEALPEQRLPALYPQVLQVLRRAPGSCWPEPLERAEAASAGARRAVLADVDFAQGRYTLVRAGEPASFALRIDAAAMVPWDEWPIPREGAARVLLRVGEQAFVLQAGAAAVPDPGSGTAAWRFGFDKVLAAESQPFDLVVEASLPWSALPWWRIALAWAAAAAVAAALQAGQRQREAKRRAEELLRLGQVGRLNALGEMAAGMAHEINQPLTALLASTQAARRLLAEEPPDLDTARIAMDQGVQQARRAGEVVARLRRLVQRPDADAPPQSLSLVDTVREVLYLLAPDAERLGVQPQLQAGDAERVRADPVAVEQIVHNLVQNALQALAQVPQGRRSLVLDVGAADERSVRLRVRDSGAGFSPEALQRAFEPFYTTRAGGLGLGLSLCETLAAGMGGAMACRNREGGGADVSLTLPRDIAEPPPP